MAAAASAPRRPTSCRAKPSPSSTSARRRRPTAAPVRAGPRAHRAAGLSPGRRRAHRRRARAFDKLASFTLGPVQAAVRTPMDAAVGRWAIAALRAPTAPRPGEEPVRIRMMGGTVPTDVLVDALQLPFVMVRPSTATTTSTRKREPAHRPLRHRHGDDLQPADHAVPAVKRTGAVTAARATQFPAPSRRSAFLAQNL